MMNLTFSSVSSVIRTVGWLAYGIAPNRAEGVRDGRWAVIDYGDVIVHIFNDDTRLFYHLERLWSDGENMEKYVDED